MKMSLYIRKFRVMNVCGKLEAWIRTRNVGIRIEMIVQFQAPAVLPPVVVAYETGSALEPATAIPEIA